MAHDILLVLIASIFAYVVHAYSMKRKQNKTGPTVIDAADRFAIRNRNMRPYAKPSDKKKPVVNDDFEAWKKENDLPRDS